MQPRVDTSHPHFVSIPDARTEGVRAYREPDVPNPLQLTFLDEAGERRWMEEIRAMLSAGRAAEADARLAADFEGFEGALASLCKATPAAAVVMDGWDDLLPILEEWEGPPITGITVGLTNPSDLVFEPGRAQEPELLVGLYSDEAFPFSSESKAQILAECGNEVPAWVGAEEDVEFYCEIAGLAELNTALIHCKHRYFLRDGRDAVTDRAPGGYVEFVLASWLMATRFLQATERAAAKKKLPAGCRLIAGTVDVNADFVAVLGPDKAHKLASAARAEPDQPSLASLTVKPWVPREDPTADAPASGPTLRQRLTSSEPEAVAERRQGFLARLFGRWSRH